MVDARGSSQEQRVWVNMPTVSTGQSGQILPEDDSKLLLLHITPSVKSSESDEKTSFREWMRSTAQQQTALQLNAKETPGLT